MIYIANGDSSVRRSTRFRRYDRSRQNDSSRTKRTCAVGVGNTQGHLRDSASPGRLSGVLAFSKTHRTPGALLFPLVVFFLLSAVTIFGV